MVYARIFLSTAAVMFSCALPLAWVVVVWGGFQYRAKSASWLVICCGLSPDRPAGEFVWG
jgi:hypothetical protein